MPLSLSDKREREKAMVHRMIALFCRKHHGSSSGLCPDCAALDNYAKSRSDNCPFMETKTFCSNCRIHCYKPDMREKIRAVMRFAGPWMIFVNPGATIRHLIESIKEKRRLKKPL